LTQSQLEFANTFVQRTEFLTVSASLSTGGQFIDAVLATVKSDIFDKNGVPVDLASQRSAPRTP